MNIKFDNFLNFFRFSDCSFNVSFYRLSLNSKRRQSNQSHCLTFEKLRIDDSIFSFNIKIEN